MRLARSTSCSALSSGDLADLLEVGADRVGGRGELGVLAGLPQRLGLLLVVPLEVAALGGLLLGRDGLDGGAVRAGDNRLVELEPFAAGIDHGDGGGVGGDGGQHGALTGSRRRDDGGLALGRGLHRGLLARGRLCGLRSCVRSHRLHRLGGRGAGAGSACTGGCPGALEGARFGCFRCWLVGGHSDSFPCWVRSPGDRLVRGQRLRSSSWRGRGPGRPARRLAARRAGDPSRLEGDGLGLSHCNGACAVFHRPGSAILAPTRRSRAPGG